MALLSATLVMSAFYSRVGKDLDVSNFLLGVAASVGLLAVAAGARVLVTDAARASGLVAWPGAFGAVGAGLMVGVLMDDTAATGYVAGLLVIALSVAGYLLVRRGAFVVATIVGLLIVYFSIFDDVVDTSDIDGENPGIVIGAAVLVFALLVSIAGWFLPETRVLSAVVVGVLAVIGNAGVLIGLAVVASFARAFQGFSELDALEGPPPQDTSDPFTNDAWLVLVFSMVLVAAWAYATYATGHVAFPLLMAAMCASVIPLVTAVIAVEHPTWWELVIGLLGGGALVLAGYRAMSSRRAG